MKCEYTCESDMQEFADNIPRFGILIVASEDETKCNQKTTQHVPTSPFEEDLNESSFFYENIRKPEIHSGDTQHTYERPRSPDKTIAVNNVYIENHLLIEKVFTMNYNNTEKLNTPELTINDIENKSIYTLRDLDAFSNRVISIPPPLSFSLETTALSSTVETKITKDSEQPNTTNSNLKLVAEDVINDLEIDESLIKATRKAASSNSLMPLTKEIVKSSIQSRRLAKGIQELSVPKFQPKQEILSEEDLHKRQNRKERNKLAAQQCRQRKKIRTEQLTHEASLLEEQHKILADEIQSLQKDKARLEQIMENHECTIKRRRKISETITSQSHAD